MYWATKHTQTTKNKPYWHQSGQRANKNKTRPEKPTYTVLGQATNLQSLTCQTTDHPYGAKLQKTWDDHHLPYAQW